jgi:threonine dehydratase
MHAELGIAELERVRAGIAPYIVQTPSRRWEGGSLADRIGAGTVVEVKLELFQRTGTFKARGAINTMLNLDAAQRARGVTAVSAGNHAVATAWAAQQLGINAKILMPQGANPYRLALARSFGAEIVIAPSHHAMFEMVKVLQEQEGRYFVHPFEGALPVQGSASAGLEFAEQVEPVDVMILPVGGGGLCAGFAAAIRQRWPAVTIYGVEPEGANAMYRSFRSGKAEVLESMSSIADSLSPPRAEPWTFAACRELVEDIVLVDDSMLRDAMLEIFYGLKLAVEPAGAATTAALLGPLHKRCAGKRVGLIVCGANMDAEGYCRHISQALADRAADV